MLLFNKIGITILTHKICNFNTSNVTIQQNRYGATGKPRIYFNTSNVTIQLAYVLDVVRLKLYFNTSNVTIQLQLKQSLPAMVYISIHLMLLFNKQL